MNGELRRDAEAIMTGAIEAVCPNEAVRRALGDMKLEGRLYLVAVGKAAWQMAKGALTYLPRPVEKGIVITKYKHVKGALPGIQCFEAGHPVADENGYRATEAVLQMTEHLTEEDTVLFLLSGGGSALFEKPLVSPEELESVTKQLLASGADIVEMNTVRKRLSAVKGGKFALHCAPSKVRGIVLSDVLGDPLDMIASGPATADTSTSEEALRVIKKYGISLSAQAEHFLMQETPKEVPNGEMKIIGSVGELCAAAEKICRSLGYEPVFLTDRLCCEAREAGRFLANILQSHKKDGRSLAFLAGGETVVHVRGTGLGGRNQELALAAAAELDSMEGAAVFSFGSDGTDGPTDAAGGYADGYTAETLRSRGVDLTQMLQNNDAYHALEASGGLLFTGPTGTNVNDLSVALLKTNVL